jgi:hypothetical protein
MNNSRSPEIMGDKPPRANMPPGHFAEMSAPHALARFAFSTHRLRLRSQHGASRLAACYALMGSAFRKSSRGAAASVEPGFHPQRFLVHGQASPNGEKLTRREAPCRQVTRGSVPTSPRSTRAESVDEAGETVWKSERRSRSMTYASDHTARCSVDDLSVIMEI